MDGHFGQGLAGAAIHTAAPRLRSLRVRRLLSELSQWSGRKVLSVHHGFDADAFTGDADAVAIGGSRLTGARPGRSAPAFCEPLQLLSEFRNPISSDAHLARPSEGQQKVKLFLTCRLESAGESGDLRADSAAALANEAAWKAMTSSSSERYLIGSLHHLYRACHIYVTPAYAESFAHPLIEAMSSGLPVVASDLPVHREICEDAGIYFPRFSPAALAERILQIQESPELAATLSRKGVRRAQAFSWSDHVDRLLSLARECQRRASWGEARPHELGTRRVNKKENL